MATIIKNIETGNELTIQNATTCGDHLLYQARLGVPRVNWQVKNHLRADGKDENGRCILRPVDGYTTVETKSPRKPRAPRKAKSGGHIPTPKTEPTPTTEPTTEPTPKAEPIGATPVISKIKVDLKAQLIKKYGVLGESIFDATKRGGFVNKEEVASIVKEVLEQNAPTKTIEVVSPRGRAKVSGAANKDFAVFCNLVEHNKPLYMYGPAGSGKSYTACQIAEALKFDYYETSQAMFAHELKGYGDAKGEFVETAFYRAFSKGGVFFLDEVDASAPEALVVLNNAIANKRFDFPVIGNVTAHENFRVIAAGNTRMTGATLEYTARQMQDTSFKNRFFFAPVTYDKNVMLAIANGDQSIVAFGADLRKAARDTGISQLFSYRQASDLANLQEACLNNDAYLIRGSVLQEKEVDDAVNLYEHLSDKKNRWAKAMKVCIEEMKVEEIW